MRKSLVAVLVLFLWLTGSTSLYAQDSSSQKVLLINSYNKGLKWTDDIVTGVEKALKKGTQLHVEYLDTKRIADSEYFHKTFALYKYKFQYSDFDAVIVSDDDALKFILDYGDSLFGDTPIVFCGVNNLNVEALENRSITGVVEKIDIEKTLELAFQLHPYTQKLLVVTDSSTTGKQYERELEDLQNGHIEIEFTSHLAMEEIQNRVSKMKHGELILLLSFTRDGAGNIFTSEEVAERLHKYANVPIYSVWNVFLDKGIVGGYLTNGLAQGQRAAELTNQILKGKAVNTIPIIKESPNEYMFDFIQLKKFGIDMKKLPEQAVIINQSSSFYKENKALVLTTAGFVFFLLIVIFMLLVNISQKKKAEKILQQQKKEIQTLNEELEIRVLKRTQQLEESNRKLKSILATLREAQSQLIESEKMAALGSLVSGIAHEINTPIGIGVTAISHLEEKTTDVLKLYESQQMKRSNLEAYFKLASENIQIIQTNLTRAKELITSFKQVAVDQSNQEMREFNVKEYLGDILFSLGPKLKKSKIKITVHCEDSINLTSYPGDFSQVITNLIMNTIIHAYDKEEEGEILIEAQRNGKDLILRYSDFGKGIKSEYLNKVFNPFFTTTRNSGGTGLGLNIVYNIVVQKFKGKISCNSELGQGTTFTIRIPMELER